MASGKDRSVAVLSIRPKYAEAIIAGTKQVEFRRRAFHAHVEYVVIYASRPVQRVVGFFKVAGRTNGTPSELWNQFRDVGGILEHEFDHYFRESERAVAIGISAVRPLDPPMTLDNVCKSLVPPQCFTYLRRETFEVLLGLAQTGQEFEVVD